MSEHEIEKLLTQMGPSIRHLGEMHHNTVISHEYHVQSQKKIQRMVNSMQRAMTEAKFGIL